MKITKNDSDSDPDPEKPGLSTIVFTPHQSNSYGPKIRLRLENVSLVLSARS